MASPTNGDIMRTLGRLEEKVESLLDQAKKTNGRVTTIEQWKNALEAVEQYKEKAGPTITAQTVVMQQKWFQNERLVGGVVAVLLAIAAVLGFWAGVPK